MFSNIILNLIFVFNYIFNFNLFSFSNVFNPYISNSFKFYINLKNVIPKENISHFSASNFPIFYSNQILIKINSGDI